jgi:hypothetical protein
VKKNSDNKLTNNTLNTLSFPWRRQESSLQFFAYKTNALPQKLLRQWILFIKKNKKLSNNSLIILKNKNYIKDFLYIYIIIIIIIITIHSGQELREEMDLNHHL